MLLTAEDIATEYRLGNIVIDPFDPERLKDCSYNVRLGTTLARYKAIRLDCKKEHELESWELTDEGFELSPSSGYLGHTVETIGVSETSTSGLVPFLEGTSGVGRMFLTPHVAASFGKFGFARQWTLELTCVQPLRVYPGQVIAQVFWLRTSSLPKPSSGSYDDQSGPVGSRLWKTFQT